MINVRIEAARFDARIGLAARIKRDVPVTEKHSAMVFPNGFHVPGVPRHESGFRNYHAKPES